MRNGIVGCCFCCCCCMWRIVDQLSRSLLYPFISFPEPPLLRTASQLPVKLKISRMHRRRSVAAFYCWRHVSVLEAAEWHVQYSQYSTVHSTMQYSTVIGCSCCSVTVNKHPVHRETSQYQQLTTVAEPESGGSCVGNFVPQRSAGTEPR